MASETRVGVIGCGNIEEASAAGRHVTISSDVGRPEPMPGLAA